MTYLPIYLELKGRRCLIVGGGDIASRRAVGLIAHEAEVAVVAPAISESLRDLERQGKVHWNPSVYESRFMDGVTLVVAATNVTAVNDRVSEDARANNVLICRADRASEGDFIFPGLIERGDLTIAVATMGGSPTLTSVLVEILGDEYGPEWSKIVELCKTIRIDIKSNGQTADSRKAGIRRILADKEIRTLLNDGKITEAEARAKECLSLF